MARRRSHPRAGQHGGQRTFRAAVTAVPAIAGAFRSGVQALKSEHRQRLENAGLATGSIDLDAALEKDFPNTHRWDYGIGLPGDQASEKVLWLEVHHAASGETERVISKLQALKAWLADHAPQLAAIPRTSVWALSNTESNPTDRRRRNSLAEKHGLRRVTGRLNLSSF